MILELLLAATVWYQPYFDKMPQATVESLQKLGKEVVVTGNPRIQGRLLAEDLHWMQRGYSDRQIDFIVAVVLELSLVKAEEELTKKDIKLEKREKIVGFIVDCNYEVDRRKKDLLPMENYELQFYY